MTVVRLSQKDNRLIEKLLSEYRSSRGRVETFQKQLFHFLADSPELGKLVHSFKARVKSEESLKDKLCRKILKSKEEKTPFRISPENLLTEINDLAGLRVLHLYPRQIREIDQCIRAILDDQKLPLREKPFARTWDDEYREFFDGCGFITQPSPSLYTSVHYAVESGSRIVTTCEIQVRTLMEEVWGEVDHNMNYPHQVQNLACREQLKVLARVTSSATRLVDSIFLTLEEFRDAAARSIDRPVRAPVPRAAPLNRQRKRATG